MKYIVFMILMSPLGFAQEHVPRCSDEMNYAYHIYQEAMKSAKEGKCNLSLQQFEESEKQWEYMANSSVCTKEEVEAARSNTHRIKYDISILKKRYCPDL